MGNVTFICLPWTHHEFRHFLFSFFLYRFSNVCSNFSGATLLISMSSSMLSSNSSSWIYIYKLLSSRCEHIRDTCNGCGRQLKTFPSSSSPPSSFAFVRQLPFSTKCRSETAQRSRTTNSPRTDDPARWKNRSRAKMGDPRVGRYGSRSRKVHAAPSPSPRKRSMSLLAGSWRSTESPGTLKRKLNEISNRQELPRIGPIKPPPVPRTYTRVY